MPSVQPQERGQPREVKMLSPRFPHIPHSIFRVAPERLILLTLVKPWEYSNA